MDPYKYHPPRAFDSSFFTTNSGAPVWNNNSSLTVGTRDEELMKIKSKFEGKGIRNGALLLEKQIASCEGKGIAIRIFTAEELNKATYNYDTSLIHSRFMSTVYKGNLDGQLVAVNKTPEGLQAHSMGRKVTLAFSVSAKTDFYKEYVEMISRI